MLPHPNAILAAEKTGVRRFLDLCDPDNPAFNPDYLEVVEAIVAGVPRPERAAPVVAPLPPMPPLPRSAKPRLSIADLARARRDCVPCREKRRPENDHTLSFRAYLTSWTGYGGIATHLGRELAANGVDFWYHDLGTDSRYIGRDPWVNGRVRNGSGPPGSPILQLAIPSTHVPSDNPTVVFSMWEASRISVQAVAELNRARTVIVPCQFNAEGFRASGVTAPIHVVPLGMEPANGFVFRPFPEGKPLTFGMSARMAHGGIRKGINEGMGAFVKAFPAGEDARLEVKVFEDCLPSLRVPSDPRIQVVTEAYNPLQMAEWFGGIDALFVPSKGEGWGLNTHQAMACGRSVIAAVYSGTADFFDGRFGWELPFIEEPAGEFYGKIGNWAVPTEDGMIDALRAAYREPDECRRKGALAAARAAEFTWDRTGRELVDVLRGIDGYLP